jgi:RNA polymerase sigma factor (sigma-70 family)
MPAAPARFLDRLRTALVPADGLPDCYLVTRFVQTRDDAAFAELVRRHGPMVLAVCRRLVGDAHLAEDAFQAVFLVLTRRAAAVKPRAAVGAFLHGVAVRTALDARSMIARRRVREAPAADPLTSDPCPADAELFQALDEEIARLPDHLRAAVVPVELEGRPRKAVADALGVPEGTLSSRLAKARKLLADRLRRRGFALPAALLAAAAVPPELGAAVSGSGPVSTTAARLAGGVFRTMLIQKLRLTTLGVLAVAAVIGLWPAAPRPLAPTAAAAPTPAKKAGEGLIWLRYFESGKLVAVDQTGKVRRTIEAKDGHTLLGLSPAENKLWFAGQGGKLANPTEFLRGQYRDDITLHVREINERTEGTDLGIPVTSLSGLSRDGTTAGIVKMLLPGTTNQAWEFENSLVDVATKKKTKLDLPDTHQFFGNSPDGTWVMTLEYVFPVEPGKPRFRLHQTPVAGGKLRLLTGTISTSSGCSISPDGRQLLVFGEDYAGLKDGKPTAIIAAFVIDVATAKAVRIAGVDTQLWSQGIWSSDGKRIVYAWRPCRAGTKDGNGQITSGVAPTRIVVCDADGKNPVTIFEAEEQVGPAAWW